jgi:uncharacterized protein
VYAGSTGDEAVREYIESSDCIILLGVLLTDVDMGANTAVLDPEVMLSLSEDGCTINRQSFPVQGLMLLPDIITRELIPHDTAGCPIPVRDRMPDFVPTGAKVSPESLVIALNSIIKDNTVLITEDGDAIMMSLDITIKRTGGFLSNAYYSSLGFGVSASIGLTFHHLIWSIYSMKQKEEIIALLKEKRPVLIQKYHITRIGIFGFVIRNEATAGSDIDILVGFDDEASLLDHSGLKIYLERLFGESVDVVPERVIRPELKEPVFSDVVFV